MRARHLLVVAAIAACGRSSPGPQPPPAAVADHERYIRQIEHGLTPAVTVVGEDERFTLADRMLHHHVPAVSIAVIDHGQIVWSRAYGVTAADETTAVTPDSLFQAASISKPVNALATLGAAAEGILTLDGPIDDKLTSWKVPATPLTAGAPVTLRRLLSHTAGTTVHGFAGYLEGAPLPTVPQILAGAPPANSAPVTVEVVPGREERYSGGGITITQLALVDQLHRPYADILAERVLRPLGMTHSTFAQPLPEARRAGLTSGHDRGGKVIGGRRHVYPEQAAAGLWTTPTDLAKFFLEIQRARAGRSALVSQQLATLMTTAVSPELPDAGVGFGLRDARGGRRFAHGGFNAGYTSIAWAALDGDHGLVIMTNGERGFELMAELERAIWTAYGWPGAPQPVARVALDAAARARLTGRYGGGMGEPFAIDARGERVWLRRPFLADVELVPVAGGAVIHRDNGAVLRPSASGLDVTPPDGTPGVVARLADEVELPLVELAAGRFERAVALQRALVARDPASSVAMEERLNGFGYLLLQRGDSASAVQVFRLDVAVFPGSANAHDSLGDALVAAGDTAAAITSYQNALAFLPKDTRISPAARAALAADTPVKLARLRATSP